MLCWPRKLLQSKTAGSQPVVTDVSCTTRESFPGTLPFRLGRTVTIECLRRASGLQLDRRDAKSHAVSQFGRATRVSIGKSKELAGPKREFRQIIIDDR